MRKHLLSCQDDMRVEVERGIPVTAKIVADLRAVATWPDANKRHSSQYFLPSKDPRIISVPEIR
jgi:hypothetical protein